MSTGLLGDTADRDYSRKLDLFNAYAEPELRRLIADLKLTPQMRIVDVGCGTGEALNWLYEATARQGTVIGFDLAGAHVKAARTRCAQEILIAQADALNAPLAPHSVDLIWCVNTVNHLRDSLEGVERLSTLLRHDGRLVLGQSSLLPEMFFAWDARLEGVVNDAVRRYYRDRYRLDERELTGVRALVGLLRRAHMRNVQAQTLLIERISPVRAADEAYLVEAIFRNTWGERLKPYLSEEDYAALARLCDPGDSAFALRRADFHYLQSFTLVTGRA